MKYFPITYIIIILSVFSINFVVAQEARKEISKTITVSQAVEDINEFQTLLEERSSYLHLSDYDYVHALQSLKSKIEVSNNDFTINYLANELAMIMGNFGDRHSSIKNRAFNKREHSYYNLNLPFTLAPVNNKVAALKRVKKPRAYKYYLANFPLVKSINGVSVVKLIDSLDYRNKKAPKASKFKRGLKEVNHFGRLHFNNNLELPQKIEVVFTNGKTDTTQIVELSEKRNRFFTKFERDAFMKSREIEKRNFENISKVLADNIGYLHLPEMYHYEDVEGFENYIDSTLKSFTNTKALIIDLRFNPGGGRELVKTFSKYIVPESQSPWVANVAYLRVNKKEDEYNSMTGRFLYKYNSQVFDKDDKKAINDFMSDFKTQRSFDTNKFSEPHFMVLKSGNISYTKPVYILVNQDSFSAATVFTSAFKGLPNVKIVGVTTDGSSGNSKRLNLKNSNIRVKLSTMLSFQRNGKTLDGNGTEPDIYIPLTENEILSGEDEQLNSLLKLINSSN